MNQREYIINKREIEFSPKNPFFIALNSPDKIHPHFLGDIHFALQICFVLNGEFEVLYPYSDNFNRRLQQGQFFMSSAWEAHAVRELSHPSKMLAVSFSIENIGVAGIEDEELNWLQPFALPPAERPFGEAESSRAKILECANEILELRNTKPFAHKTKIWLKILSMLMHIVEISPKSENTGKTEDLNRIMPAILLLQKAGPEYPTVVDCAAACNLSRSRFSYIFSSVMGFSIGKFLLRSKMSKAEKLVNNSNMPFKEISFQCGFRSVNSFYHTFCEYFKTTPMNMRKDRNSEKRLFK